MEVQAQNTRKQIVGVYPEKCVNCHACISACPVKFCNNASGDYITLDPNLCIGCGSCIDACTHEARYYIDDFEKFKNDLINGEKFIAIAAPAVAASFEADYMKLNGFLRQLGVEAIFDVSFGAELTIKSYIEHLKEVNFKTTISQACPSLVNYVEIYKPELIKYLAPVDSPMLHTIKMIREYYPQYSDYKIAAISPCNAKSHEFESTTSNVYNIAHKSIIQFLQENNESLSDYPERDYDNPPAERAVQFSSPGGLLKTLERWIPDAADFTRKIEGVELVYDYLDKLPQMIEEGKAPILIDCLSCANGCNAGPLTPNRKKSPDETEYWVRKREQNIKKKYLTESNNNPKASKEVIEKYVDDFWKKNLYQRTYTNQWKNLAIKYPTDNERDAIYKSMHKYTENDILNCSSCGYGNCADMALAIHNNLNKPEHCHYYLKAEAHIAHVSTEKEKIKLNNILENSQDGFVLVDLNETILEANSAMCKILKKADIIGRNFNEFVHDSNKHLIKQQSSERAKGKSSSYELILEQSDGSTIECLISASPQTDFDKKTRVGSFAMVTDISELKKAEKELKELNSSLEKRVKERTEELNETLEELKQQQEEILTQRDALADSEARTMHVLSNMPNPVLGIDAKGKVILWNSEMEKLTGVEAESMIGKGNKEYAIPFYGEARSILIDLASMDENFLKQNYQNVLKKGAVIQAESFVPKLKGEEAYLMAYATALYDREDRYLGAIEVIQDQTISKRQSDKIKQQKEWLSENLEELNQQQEEILAQRDALAESEDRTMRILANMPNPAMGIDENGKVVLWNSEMEKLTGVDAEKMIGKGNYEYAIPFYNSPRKILIDLAAMDDDYLQKNYKNISKKGEVIQAESYVPNLKGEEKYLMAYATAFYDKNGSYQGAIEVLQDMTENKKFLDKIQLQHQQLISQSEKMSDMIEELNVSNTIIEESNHELEKLSIVASETDNVVIIMDKEGNFEWVNRAYNDIYGLTLDQLIEKKGRNFLQASRFKNIKHIYELVKRKKESQIFIVSEKNKNREEIFVQTTLTPVLDFSGNIKKLVAIKSDITELKRAESALIEQQEQILFQRDLANDQKRKITDSIHYASRIQQAMLPPDNYISSFLADYFVFFKPRDIVSGDFYWIHKRNNKIILIAADSTGHGVPGAFMSMLGISFLNEIIISQKVTQADEILNLLRNGIKKALRQRSDSDSKDGMDVAVCIIDSELQKVQYAGAHNPLLRFSGGEMIIYKADRMPVGVHRNDHKPFFLHEIDLVKGDKFYIYSDGFLDQFNLSGRKLMHNNFRELIKKNHTRPMLEQHDLLDQSFADWKQEAKQTDDILVIGFTV